jgi:hypothetical protein
VRKGRRQRATISADVAGWRIDAPRRSMADRAAAREIAPVDGLRSVTTQ